MSYMRSLAAAAGGGRRTVVASVHQPRAAIWSLFDSCLLLSGGRMMYSGPRSALLPWFTSGGLGYTYSPALHGAPSDWVMDLVNVGFAKPEVRTTD